MSEPPLGLLAWHFADGILQMAFCSQTLGHQMTLECRLD